MVSYTKHFLNKMEDLFSETDYILRYEKGNFQSGYCILNETKIVVVNKYFSLEGKINSLLEIIKLIEVREEGLSEKNQKFYSSLLKKEVEN